MQQGDCTFKLGKAGSSHKIQQQLRYEIWKSKEWIDALIHITRRINLLIKFDAVNFFATLMEFDAYALYPG